MAAADTYVRARIDAARGTTEAAEPPWSLTRRHRRDGTIVIAAAAKL